MERKLERLKALVNRQENLVEELDELEGMAEGYARYEPEKIERLAASARLEMERACLKVWKLKFQLYEDDLKS